MRKKIVRALRVAIKTNQEHCSTGRKRVCTWKTLKTGASQQITTGPQGEIVKCSQKKRISTSAGMFTLKVMSEELEEKTGESQTMQNCMFE